jgi:hypothetical protein
MANHNVATYAAYLGIIGFIIGYVGQLFYRAGRVFILSLFKGDEEQTDYVNKALLVAYYLFNLGYSFERLRWWGPVPSLETALSSLASYVGVLVLILAVTHYFNMALIYYLSTRKDFIHND